MRPSPDTRPPATSVGALLLAVLVASSAQQVLLPALAPFARETGLDEAQLGIVIGVSAACLVVASPLWARRCAARGARAVLVAGLVIATAGLLAFGVVATAALDDRLDPTSTFVLMMITRGLVFGTGLAAVPVAAMSYVASHTTAAERTGGLARLGAAQGAAIVVGPALGGAVALAGLLGPVWTAPLAVAAALILVLLRVPGAATDAPPPTVGPLRPWDPRVRSWLLVGFLLYSGLGLVLLTLGFAVQDRGGLTGDAAARVTSVITVVCGLALAVVQGVVVPRLRWAPHRLLCTGVPVASLGLAALAVAPGTWAIAGAMVLVALGMAVASPGYVAGATLGVADHEQSAVAGLVSVANGLAFVVGPALGGALYAAAYPLPFAAAAAVTLLGLGVLVADRRPAPTGQAAS